MGFADGSMAKNQSASARDAGDMGSAPGTERSSGGGNGTLLQYSCQEKFHEQRSLTVSSPWDHQESDTMSHWVCMHTHTHTHTHTHIPGNTIALEEISVAVCKRCSIVKQIWKILLTNGQMAFFTAINMLTWTVDLLRACATCVLYQSYILKKQLWEMFISEKPQPPIELVANRARHPCWHHLGKLRLAL